MPSSKSLFAALCLLCLPPGVLAERPTTRVANGNDSRQNNPAQDTMPPIPREIGGKTLEEWKKDLAHPDPSVRANAISVIPGFRENAMECVQLLIDRTHDKDASPRVKAVLALKFMGINGADRERVVKALGERIATDSQAIVRYEAAQALTRFGADGQAVVGDLVKGLGDTSTWELRHACIIALIVAGVDEKKGPDDRVTTALIPRTKPYYEPSRQVRLEAIIAMGAMGRPHAPSKLDMVIRALKEHEHSTDKAIKIWTHVSLMALEDKIDDKKLKMIVGCLDDRDREVRKQAVIALGAMQKKAEKHIKDICDLLRTEKEPMVQSAACGALARMGDKSDRVLRALIRMSEKDSTETIEVVMSACQSLAQIHVASKEVTDAMDKVLEHRSLNPQQKENVRQYIEMIKKPLPDEGKKKPAVERGVGKDKP